MKIYYTQVFPGRTTRDGFKHDGWTYDAVVAYEGPALRESGEAAFERLREIERTRKVLGGGWTGPKYTVQNVRREP